MSNRDMSAIELMSALERDAFDCAEDVARLQLFLDIASGLMASIGLGLLLVSAASLASLDAVRARPFRVTLSVGVLCWTPLSILIGRVGTRRSRSSPEQEFRAFLDQFPGTASRPVVWSKINYGLRGMDDELRLINADPNLRCRIVAAYGLRRLRLALPLGAVGLALAGACAFVVVVAGGSMTATVNLLILPGLCLAALGIFRFYFSTY